MPNKKKNPIPEPEPIPDPINPPPADTGTDFPSPEPVIEESKSFFKAVRDYLVSKCKAIFFELFTKVITFLVVLFNKD